MTSAYLQDTMNIAEICAQLGVEDAILSPGSRCAPLVIAFSRHPSIQVKSVTDERAAAFIALGIAQHKQKPVVIICTSGTAALNYSPAIAEAFYQQIPLIVMTADRPPEWIEQQDGQTIKQNGIYQNYTKACFSLPVNNAHPDVVWHIERTVSEAINLALSPPYAPVHLNVPFREPFYPQENQTISFNTKLKVIKQVTSQGVLDSEQWQDIIAEMSTAKRILIVAGQQYQDETLALNSLKIPVIGDIISNLHGVEGVIQHADMFLAVIDEKTKQDLRPDLLISFGQSIISKNLKLFLRAYPAKQHWHIQFSGQVADPYQSLTKIIRLNSSDFFATLKQRVTALAETEYSKRWHELDSQSKQLSDSFFIDKEFSEFGAIKTIMDFLPEQCVLHLGNSMPIRYANFIALTKAGVKVFSNRGTSGIDGCMSTAVGHSLATDKLNILLIGDLSFFYDRNALWHASIPINLRVIVLNNHGGGIFNILPDPKQLPELDEFFVTPHDLNAENTAKDFALEYDSCDDKQQLKKCLDSFFSLSETAKLLEIHTDRVVNDSLFKQWKDYQLKIT